jgi:hypothetical protein
LSKNQFSRVFPALPVITPAESTMGTVRANRRVTDKPEGLYFPLGRKAVEMLDDRFKENLGVMHSKTFSPGNKCYCQDII